jgi:iron complex outermembrane receptor protein
MKTVKHKLHPKMSYSRIALSVISCCFTLGLSTVAIAQEESSAQEETRSGLEVIEVTARKTVESLQSTPIAVSAFTERGLKERGLTTSADVGNFTPNVQFDTSSSFAGASTFQGFIRGIGQTDFAINTDPGVGVYVDGIYIARTVGSIIDLQDVERIEVLKGPQGTLFGRNSIGGALNIITKDPGDEFDFKGEFTVGEFNRADVNAFVTLPLTDDVSTSIAISTRNRDGFQNRIPFEGLDTGNNVGPLDQILTSDANNGREQGAINSQTLRAKTHWYASDTVDATFTFDYSSVRDSATATTLLSAENDTPGSLRPLFNGCVLGQAPAEICNTSPFLANERLPFDNRFLTDDIDTTFATGANFSNIDSWGLSAEIDWEISENLSLKSLTGFRNLDGNFGVDIDGSPVVFDQTTFTLEAEQFSQEFQLSGQAGIVRYTAGVYFYTEEAGQEDFVPVAGGLIQISGGNFQDTDAFALFGETNIDLTDDLSFVFGVRFTDDEKVVRIEQQNLNPDFFVATGFPLEFFPRDDQTFLGPEEPQELDFTNTSIRTGLNWQINRDLFTYFSFSQGFKSGGITTRLTAPFNPAIGVGGLTDLTFDEETVDSFEVGLKAELFDNNLRVNVALFQNSFDDIQIVVQRGITPANENAGEAEIKGLEIEAQAVLSPTLNVNFSLGLLDAEYEELDPLVALDPSSLELPNTPDTTASIALVWQPTDNWAFNANYSYASEVYNDFENTELLRENDSAIAGASIIYTSPSEQWNVTAGVTNLTDERRLVSGFNNGALGLTLGSFNRPREYYLSVGYNF